MSENDQNLYQLEADLDRFGKVMDLAPALVTRRLVFDAHSRFSLRTPVDTGRARASWDVSVGKPSDYLPPVQVGSAKKKGKTALGSGLAGNALGSGASAGGSTKDISAAMSQIDGTKPVYVTTNLDYMQYLETGSSRQAPAGMVRLSLAEMEIEIESILEQVAVELEGINR